MKGQIKQAVELSDQGVTFGHETLAYDEEGRVVDFITHIVTLTWEELASVKELVKDNMKRRGTLLDTIHIGG